MKKAMKKEYVIAYEVPTIGTEVYNFLEDVHYTTSEKKPIVLTGTVGEQWVIDPQKFCRTYMTEEGKRFDPENFPWGLNGKVTPVQDGVYVYVVEHTQEIKKVKTSWGEELTTNRPEVPHGTGDYIVCAATEEGLPNLDDQWVVNGLIFESTYNIF